MNKVDIIQQEIDRLTEIQKLAKIDNDYRELEEMNPEKTLKMLKFLNEKKPNAKPDIEGIHFLADQFLLRFLKHLGYESIVKEFMKLDKWYS